MHRYRNRGRYVNLQSDLVEWSRFEGLKGPKHLSVAKYRSIRHRTYLNMYMEFLGRRWLLIGTFINNNFFCCLIPRHLSVIVLLVSKIFRQFKASSFTRILHGLWEHLKVKRWYIPSFYLHLRMCATDTLYQLYLTFSPNETVITYLQKHCHKIGNSGSTIYEVKIN